MDIITYKNVRCSAGFCIANTFAVYSHFFPSTATTNPSAAVVGISVGVPILLLLTVAIGVILWRKKRSSGPKKTEEIAVEEEDSWSTKTPGASSTQSALQDPCFPPHFVLKKGENLREKAKKMSDNQAELNREYKWILNYVKEKISKESNVSLQEKNQYHNRYLDIGSLVKNRFATVVLIQF